MSVHWSTADIADVIADGLKQRAADDDAEQVVYGFDHLDELGLHPLVQQSLKAGSYGVWPEQQYPSDWGRSKRSEGKRCDVVITPDATSAGLREPSVKNTLFDTPDKIDPEQAYWLEIKTVAQFETSGPFKRYTSELLSPVAQDVKKLWSDPLIFHSGLLLLLFTQDETTSVHDLAVWHERCVSRGYPVSPPAVRGIKLTDRIGNGYCSVAVFGVRGG